MQTRYNNIQRSDDDRTHTYAWIVKLQRRKRVAFKHFSDSRYGGKKKALAAALRYRDAVLKEMQNSSYGLWIRNIKRKDNTSGMIGIARYVRRNRSRSNPKKFFRQVVWQAFWMDADGKRHSKKFAVKKYGERK